MYDRSPKYPGRIKLIPVEGQDGVYDMVRADEPEREGSALNAANLLSDEVIEKLHLDGTSVPNDAFNLFSVVNEYNRYWWKRAATSSVMVESRSTETNVTVITVYYESEYDGIPDISTIYYSSDYTMNADGTFVLNSPSALSTTGETQIQNTLKGKYFSTSGSAQSKIYYFPTSGATIDKSINRFEDGSFSWVYYATSANALTSYLKDATDGWEYLTADTEDAYPNGTVGNVQYVYLGKPLDNALEAAKIATGSYTGTGSAVTLTFDFTPKFLAVVRDSSTTVTSDYIALFSVSTNRHLVITYNSNNPVGAGKVTHGTNTVTISDYLKVSGITYNYFAIG